MKIIKTQEEIDIMISLLEENKKTARPKTSFGDDNLNALDCMIKTLKEKFDADSIYDQLWNSHSESAAISVLDWLYDSDCANEDLLYPS